MISSLFFLCGQVKLSDNGWERSDPYQKFSPYRYDCWWGTHDPPFWSYFVDCSRVSLSV